MPSYTVTTSIGAPPERVWPLVADLTRHPEWAADTLTVEPDGDPGVGGPGARYRSTAEAKGRTFSAELAVTQADPPRTFAFTASDATGRYEHTFTLAPDGGGTRVTRRISGSLTPAQALLFWLVLLPIKRPSAARSLARLKECAERS